jgi:DNA-directed RNA polymerase specialized sigma24 family protein
MRRQGLIYSEDQYHYSPEVVKAALRVGLAYRRADVEPAWPTGDEEESGVRARSDPAEGNNLQAIMVDVLRGFDALARSDRDLLELAYLFGLTQAEVGQRWQVTENAVEHQHRRAIDRLIDVLGGARRRAAGDHDGPGARTALSNEEAQRQVE